MSNQDSLIALLKHPQVKKRLNIEILLGLSGHTQIDYAIGIIEKTITELEDSVSSSLKKEYNLLKEDSRYKRHFTKSRSKKLLNPEDRYKNPAYKAINGF